MQRWNNVKIAFSGFFNLYTCTKGKVLRFQFKSKFFALLLKLISVVNWFTKDLLILKETGSKFWTTKFFFSLHICVSADY